MFYRGSVPCTYLFVGEAPGESENLGGEPFIGRSGDFLDVMIINAGIPLRNVAYTNTILCAPFTDKYCDEMRAPSKEEIHNCSPRLKEFIEIASPEIIIAVGVKSKEVLTKLKLDFEPILHPAFILRKGGRGSVEYARTVLKLKEIKNREVKTKTP